MRIDNIDWELEDLIETHDCFWGEYRVLGIDDNDVKWVGYTSCSTLDPQIEDIYDIELDTE